MNPKKLSPLEKIIRQIRVDESGCWLWQSATDHDGYALVHVDGVQQLAHRVAYVLAVGAIPDGLVLDHTCRQRSCVNPFHLEPVTQLENVRRGALPGLMAARWQQYRDTLRQQKERAFVGSLFPDGI